ncbi:hypothetical protein DAEQUDRAFT_472698 [Daedalea quercina L-15889]|uniref:DUF1857-domain-containing protein n=1 Tax=Daedalea quercina L-15889 TaxID=1314783 RepID=A0A165MZ46_9APHY|nr:hypothetical protein DAEQUDRAFT_472698 [Daedalea quercina L-15889]
MRFVAVTVPVNTPDEPVQLTKEQLYQGLLVKARDPARFIPGIVRCDVLDTFATGLNREAEFKDKPGVVVHERFEWFPPSQVISTMTSPLTGERLGQITNVISVTPSGELLLTFTFAWGENGDLDVGNDAELMEQQWQGRGFESVRGTLRAIRRLVAAGDL